MTDQPRLRDRVRVTYEATVSYIGPKGITVDLPGDDECAVRFSRVPPHAIVEILRPTTLAERMTDLADELEQYGGGKYGFITESIVRRIREDLTAVTEPPRRILACGMRGSFGPFEPIIPCTLSSGHDGSHNWADSLGGDR